MATSALAKTLTIVDHPLVLHKLTLMRDKHTPSAVFRQLLREISLLLAYEVSRDLPMTTQIIETPVAEMEAPILKGKKLVIVSILRAGNGLLEGMLDLMPSARVGHIGAVKNPDHCGSPACPSQAYPDARQAYAVRRLPPASARDQPAACL